MIVINFQAQLETGRKEGQEDGRTRGREEGRKGRREEGREEGRKSLLSQIEHLSLDKKAHLPERPVHS
jgi:flagellar biosynthesis/type III secretory pathway protein FliH